MGKLAFATTLLLVSFGLAKAEVFVGAFDKTPPPPGKDKVPPPPGVGKTPEFTASITKVDGDKIYIIKFGPPMIKKGEAPKEPEFLTAAESCKVFMAGKTNDPVEDGLGSKLFKKATVQARITTEGDKVTKIIILDVLPDNEFRAMLKKVDGQKITFMKMRMPGTGGAGKKPEDTTLTAIDDVKVTEMKFDKETKKREPVPLVGGLKNEILSKTVPVLIIVDDDQKIIEIRVNPAPPGGGIVPPLNPPVPPK